MLNFNRKAHLTFIKNLTRDDDYIFSSHIKMNAIYWALATLKLLGLDNKDINTYSPMSIDNVQIFLNQCEDLNKGGWGGDIGLDSHILFTLSAIQIHKLLNLSILNKSKHIEYILARFNNNSQKEHEEEGRGSFTGDQWGEVDSRFSYCAIASLALLVGIENISQYIDPSLVALYIWKCWNFDGGFGARPDCESHAGQIWCCLATLSILEIPIPFEKRKLLIRWLSWRQKNPNGGFNGRPEKLEDICYSWWVLASLNLVSQSFSSSSIPCHSTLPDCNFINESALENFIFSCQDEETGGFSDRPGDVSDIFHTLFAITGLSLLKVKGGDGRMLLRRVDPRFCLPIIDEN